MEIIDRTQFIKHFNTIFEDHSISNDNHVIWEAEKFDANNRIICKWFVCIKPLNWKNGQSSSKEYWANKKEYWAWCNENLKGQVTCFSSDDAGREEWWGFEDKNDILIWILRWAK